MADGVLSETQRLALRFADVAPGFPWARDTASEPVFAEYFTHYRPDVCAEPHDQLQVAVSTYRA